MFVLGFGWWRADKKDIFKSFRMDLNCRAPHHAERRVYHQNEVLYITKAKALYIIIAKEDAACGWWYTRLVEIYSARRMRYTLKRDEIQPQRGWWYTPHFVRQWYAKPAAWINKFDKSKLVEFFGRGRRTWFSRELRARSSAALTAV